MKDISKRHEATKEFWATRGLDPPWARTYVSFIDDVNATCMDDIAFILLAAVVSWCHDIRWVPPDFPHGVCPEEVIPICPRNQESHRLIVWSFIVFVDMEPLERAGDARSVILLG